MKKKRNGFLYKFIFVAALVYCAVTIASLQGQIASRQSELNSLQQTERQENYRKGQREAQLSDELTDEEVARIARAMGYAFADEHAYINVPGNG